MIRLHIDTYAPKYYSGKWTWDSNIDGLDFHPHNDLSTVNDRYIDTNGYRFLRTLNPEEEAIFRQFYVRPDTTFDADTVVINDVRDLVLFMMPKEFLSMKFLRFMHEPAVHRLLHSLIIYFEYYLRMVEFVLIRRDEVSGKIAQIQSEQTNEMKRTFSIYLSQYRLLVARNYSVIILGEGDTLKYYHTKPIVKFSSKIKDLWFHEHFLAVATQIVWIANHRRAYYLIEMEMNRLFRCEHFLMNCPHYIKFTPVERCVIYGRNNKMVNYRKQTSPLIEELNNVAEEDMPILWIGERMYRGTDARIMELQLEYIVPGPQLQMIDVAHGILGHPKCLYNTIYNLDWPQVRFANFSKENDPYYIIRQPTIRIPNLDEQKVRKMSKKYDMFFSVFRIYEAVSMDMLMRWQDRDKLVAYYVSGGVLKDTWMRCKDLLKDEDRDVTKVIETYYDKVARLRKRISVKGEDGKKKRKVGYKRKGVDAYFE